mmetsp:Transcript_5417/g.8167  ORF Transcript_5417/g.8167 Transcript_5417/m.8167 type:complete len:139 (+) Transcript_5417:2-418(+)
MCMQNCGEVVRKSLEGLDGVMSVSVHFPTRTVSVQIPEHCGTKIQNLLDVVESIGYHANCISVCSSKTPLQKGSENAVWAIAEVLGLVDPGCSMSWGDPCSCDPYKCRCANCEVHAALREDLKTVFEGCALAQKKEGE